MGKPIIKGTRITVEIIVRKLADGFSYKDVLQMYAHIKMNDIKACIANAS